MIYYESPSHDAFFNMALEEALLQQPLPPDGCLLLWQNENAVVVGRHQHTPEEINADFVARQGIQVVRRLSGGGAMYQDLGNLNFTFVVRQPAGAALDFGFFIRPVVQALGQMGVPAQAAGRNDILVAGKKVSGNAQLRRGPLVLHHGTLLFCSRLEMLAATLRGKPRAEGRGVASVPSRVCNIAEHLPRPMPLQSFKQLLLQSLAQVRPLEQCPLDEALLQRTEMLRRSRYATDAWNYGAGPSWNLRRAKRFAFGNVCVLLDMEPGGTIRTAHIYGDFFGAESLHPLEEALAGAKLELAALQKLLAPLDTGQWIRGMQPEQLARLLAGEEAT